MKFVRMNIVPPVKIRHAGQKLKMVSKIKLSIQPKRSAIKSLTSAFLPTMPWSHSSITPYQTTTRSTHQTVALRQLTFLYGLIVNHTRKTKAMYAMQCAVLSVSDVFKTHFGIRAIGMCVRMKMPGQYKANAAIIIFRLRCKSIGFPFKSCPVGNNYSHWLSAVFCLFQMLSV